MALEQLSLSHSVATKEGGRWVQQNIDNIKPNWWSIEFYGWNFLFCSLIFCSPFSLYFNPSSLFDVHVFDLTGHHEEKSQDTTLPSLEPTKLYLWTIQFCFCIDRSGRFFVLVFSHIHSIRLLSTITFFNGLIACSVSMVRWIFVANIRFWLWYISPFLAI